MMMVHSPHGMPTPSLTGDLQPKAKSLHESTSATQTHVKDLLDGIQTFTGLLFVVPLNEGIDFL